MRKSKYIQQQLGHGSISITLDIYSHLFQDDHRHQVHRLDDPQAGLSSSTSVTPESATQAQPHCRQQLDGHSGAIELKKEPAYGGVTERPNVPVLKTGDLARGPRVQISPPPPCLPGNWDFWSEIVAQLWLNSNEARFFQSLAQVGFTYNCIPPINRLRFVSRQLHGN